MQLWQSLLIEELDQNLKIKISINKTRKEGFYISIVRIGHLVRDFYITSYVEFWHGYIYDNIIMIKFINYVKS